MLYSKRDTGEDVNNFRRIIVPLAKGYGDRLLTER